MFDGFVAFSLGLILGQIAIDLFGGVDFAVVGLVGRPEEVLEQLILVLGYDNLTGRLDDALEVSDQLLSFVGELLMLSVNSWWRAL